MNSINNKTNPQNSSEKLLNARCGSISTPSELDFQRFVALAWLIPPARPASRASGISAAMIAPPADLSPLENYARLLWLILVPLQCFTASRKFSIVSRCVALFWGQKSQVKFGLFCISEKRTPGVTRRYWSRNWHLWVLLGGYHFVGKTYTAKKGFMIWRQSMQVQLQCDEDDAKTYTDNFDVESCARIGLVRFVASAWTKEANHLSIDCRGQHRTVKKRKISTGCRAFWKHCRVPFFGQRRDIYQREAQCCVELHKEFVLQHQHQITFVALSLHQHSANHTVRSSHFLCSWCGGGVLFWLWTDQLFLKTEKVSKMCKIPSGIWSNVTDGHSRSCRVHDTQAFCVEDLV